jgi:hypothetical protein
VRLVAFQNGKSGAVRLAVEALTLSSYPRLRSSLRIYQAQFKFSYNSTYLNQKFMTNNRLIFFLGNGCLDTSCKLSRKCATHDETQYACPEERTNLDLVRNLNSCILNGKRFSQLASSSNKVAQDKSLTEENPVVVTAWPDNVPPSNKDQYRWPQRE